MRWLPFLSLAAFAGCTTPMSPTCVLNSDCDLPLVCRDGRCAPECAGDRDCMAGLACVGQRCVVGGTDAPTDAPGPCTGCDAPVDSPSLDVPVTVDAPDSPPICGSADEICCGAPMSPCDDDLVCDEPTARCVPCGSEGEPCCESFACRAALRCTGGTCTSCVAMGGVCAGATCCPDAICSGGICAACGQVSQPCCAGSACASGLTCVMMRCR